MDKGTLGAQGITWSVWGGEAISVIFDLRWALLLVVALLLTDFWWGKSESHLLYDEAKKAGNHVGMEMYKFRWSRAVRRTLNKSVDYITFVLIGVLLGLAITEPYGLLNHTQTAALALLLAIFIELASIWGHIKIVRHLDGRSMTMVGKIASVLIRKKSEELADTIDDAVEILENKEKD